MHRSCQDVRAYDQQSHLCRSERAKPLGVLWQGRQAVDLIKEDVGAAIQPLAGFQEVDKLGGPSFDPVHDDRFNGMRHCGLGRSFHVQKVRGEFYRRQIQAEVSISIARDDPSFPLTPHEQNQTCLIQVTPVQQPQLDRIRMFLRGGAEVQDPIPDPGKDDGPRSGRQEEDDFAHRPRDLVQQPGSWRVADTVRPARVGRDVALMTSLEGRVRENHRGIILHDGCRLTHGGGKGRRG